MNIILGWITTPFVIIGFWTILIFFHPIQLLAIQFGYIPHKKVVDLMNRALLWALKVNATSVKIINNQNIPKNRPIIIVSNHQNLYDIPLIHVAFAKYHPKYVSKIELAKGIPSVSFNIRHGGSVAIDRSDRRQSVAAIEKLGRYIEQHKYAASIFPEGTRAKDGVMKPFKPAGLMMLMKAAPSAVIVPVAIEDSWKLLQYKSKPINYGGKITLTVLTPIDPGTMPPKEVVREIERRIREKIGQPASDQTSNLSDQESEAM